MQGLRGFGVQTIIGGKPEIWRCGFALWMKRDFASVDGGGELLSFTISRNAVKPFVNARCSKSLGFNNPYSVVLQYFANPQLKISGGRSEKPSKMQIC